MGMQLSRLFTKAENNNIDYCYDTHFKLKVKNISLDIGLTKIQINLIKEIINILSNKIDSIDLILLIDDRNKREDRYTNIVTHICNMFTNTPLTNIHFYFMQNNKYHLYFNVQQTE